jgi:hypothetical protein
MPWTCSEVHITMASEQSARYLPAVAREESAGGQGGGNTHRVVGEKNNVVLLGGHRGVVHLTLLDIADNRVVGADRVELVGVELCGIPGDR